MRENIMKKTVKMIIAGVMTAIMILSMTACAAQLVIIGTEGGGSDTGSAINYSENGAEKITGEICSREEFIAYMPENVTVPELPEGYSERYVYDKDTGKGGMFISKGTSFTCGLVITPCENENPATEANETITHDTLTEENPDDSLRNGKIVTVWERNHASYRLSGSYFLQNGEDDADYLATFRSLCEYLTENS